MHRVLILIAFVLESQDGPVGYLRTATLTPGVDTIDTFISSRNGGAIAHGNGTYVVRTIGFVASQQWGVTDTWFDSTRKETARQSVRTARGSLATELETVRAVGDSGSLLITRDRATGWVVPQGAPTPRLIDGAVTSERFAGTIITMAIAKAAPQVGRLFVAPMGALYGANPLAITIDTIRVVRRDTLYAGSRAMPVYVLERANGGQAWVDVTTGAQLLARGSAGPERWWWHIRRGVSPPTRW